MFPGHDDALRLESTLADMHKVGKVRETASCTAAIRPCVRSLDISGTAHRIRGAGVLDQHAVAGSLHEPAAMLGSDLSGREMRL
ncbi:MAG: hypothetical protein P4L92_10435, partial [Rudaea sp.]|nr:hypothetical protein [Rudaea sp.]